VAGNPSNGTTSHAIGVYIDFQSYWQILYFARGLPPSLRAGLLACPNSMRLLRCGNLAGQTSCDKRCSNPMA